MESKDGRAIFESLSPEEQRLELGRLNTLGFLEHVSTFYEGSNDESDAEMRKQVDLAINIAKKIRDEGGRALVVGGYARDKALEKLGYKFEPKDIDIEIYGIENNKLLEILKRFGEPDTVGMAFGVIKIGGSKTIEALDVSIPRKDSKIGEGHRGFTVTGDPNMRPKEAARRRDFTINALALDPLTGEIVDHWGGFEDMEKKILRAVDPELFKDDPLRVLRAMQFVGRLGFSIDPATIELCRGIELSHLSKERVRDEWKKLLLKSPKPSIGLEAALELGIIEKLHPELRALIGVPQDHMWHPEGDVWIHTKMVVDAAAERAAEKNLSGDQALVVILASLCHDFGKPFTTETNKEGRIISHKHSEEGIEPALSFLNSIDMPVKVIDRVLPLIREHLVPSLQRNPSNSAVKKLARRLYPATIEELVIVGYADHKGRTTEWDGYPEGDELLKKAEEASLEASKPNPLLMGRDLINMGMDPKAFQFNKILLPIFEFQLSDKIKTLEEAKRLAALYQELLSFETKDIPPVKLLNGDELKKEEMIEYVKSRFIDEKVHDVGTLTMLLILRREAMPPVLEKNKEAICTAHKFGPIWFSRLDRDFYETSWKSFYARFEVDALSMEQIKTMNHEEQTKLGLELIKNPDENLILKYNETFNIKPALHKNKHALFVTDQYPFEAGMIDGYRMMVQYNPEKRRISVSVLDEDTARVAEIDKKIRDILPEFVNAKKVGYLSAVSAEGEDNVFTEEDARRIYETLKQKVAI